MILVKHRKPKKEQPAMWLDVVLSDQYLVRGPQGFVFSKHATALAAVQEAECLCEILSVAGGRVWLPNPSDEVAQVLGFNRS